MKHLVIGLGEVGAAMQKVLGCDGYDPEQHLNAPNGPYDMLHICFPHSDKFVEFVDAYKNAYKPKNIVIHSTVPIGTSRICKAVHAPIRGVHPNLARSITEFKMFVGGDGAWVVAPELKKFGIPAVPVRAAEDTEAMKLWDTTQYGVMIMLNKEIHDFCEKYKLDFNIVYSLANSTYNETYRRMGRPEVVRPHLRYMAGKIGGHCVVQNAHLLESESAKKIISENEKYA